MNQQDLYEELDKRPHPWFILVVGAPGSGKTTLALDLKKRYEVVRFSTDDKLELLHRQGKLKREDAFDKINFGNIVGAMKLMIFHAVNMGQSIVLDQTSMSRDSRMRKLAWCGPRHVRICIDFQGLTVDELDRRVQGRVKRGGRHIPRHVISDMLCKYERPTKDEGFDFIFNLSN